MQMLHTQIADVVLNNSMETCSDADSGVNSSESPSSDKFVTSNIKEMVVLQLIKLRNEMKANEDKNDGYISTMKKEVREILQENVLLKKQMHLMEDKALRLEKTMREQQLLIWNFNRDQQLKRLVISGVAQGLPLQLVIDGQSATSDWQKINLIFEFLELGFLPERMCRLTDGDSEDHHTTATTTSSKKRGIILLEFTKYTERNIAKEKFQTLSLCENNILNNIRVHADLTKDYTEQSVYQMKENPFPKNTYPIRDAYSLPENIYPKRNGNPFPENMFHKQRRVPHRTKQRTHSKQGKVHFGETPTEIREYFC